jgi:hypothetical protein
MPRTIEQIIEDITSLWQAWPTAPRELFDELQEELAEAVLAHPNTEVIPCQSVTMSNWPLE